MDGGPGFLRLQQPRLERREACRTDCPDFDRGVGPVDGLHLGPSEEVAVEGARVDEDALVGDGQSRLGVDELSP